MKISYDYSDMIQELKEELSIGALEERSYIYVEREPHSQLEAYLPIVDWYYIDDFKALEEQLREVQGSTFERLQVKNVLKEMENWNRII